MAHALRRRACGHKRDALQRIERATPPVAAKRDPRARVADAFPCHARLARSAPRLSGHGPEGCSEFMSPSATWIGCIDAITPSVPRRGMSAASIVSMCSMRCRRPPAGSGLTATHARTRPASSARRGRRWRESGSASRGDPSSPQSDSAPPPSSSAIRDRPTRIGREHRRRSALDDTIKRQLHDPGPEPIRRAGCWRRAASNRSASASENPGEMSSA